MWDKGRLTAAGCCCFVSIWQRHLRPPIYSELSPATAMHALHTHTHSHFHSPPFLSLALSLLSILTTVLTALCRVWGQLVMEARNWQLSAGIGYKCCSATDCECFFFWRAGGPGCLANTCNAIWHSSTHLHCRIHVGSSSPLPRVQWHSHWVLALHSNYQFEFDLRFKSTRRAPRSVFYCITWWAAGTGGWSL